jgi:hypothetical protein
LRSRDYFGIVVACAPAGAGDVLHELGAGTRRVEAEDAADRADVQAKETLAVRGSEGFCQLEAASRIRGAIIAGGLRSESNIRRETDPAGTAQEWHGRCQAVKRHSAPRAHG